MGGGSLRAGSKDTGPGSLGSRTVSALLTEVPFLEQFCRVINFLEFSFAINDKITKTKKCSLKKTKCREPGRLRRFSTNS